MDTFLKFLFLADPNIRYVVVGTFLLTSSTAVVGSFALLKKKVLVGDAVAHAVLPGVCLAFILTGTKNLFYLAVGACFSGGLSLVLIDSISQSSKIKEDTAIALILSVAFGIGILMLTAIQHSGNAAQVGLTNFLFGKAASLVRSDLQSLGALSLLLLGVVWVFFKEFTLVAFDKAFAQAIGLPVWWLELLMTVLTVLSIVIGIRAVGILLMAAMLVTPAAAARFWTDSLPQMLILAAVLGMVAGWTGALVSYLIPAMPTGPWIVMVVSLIAYLSFLLAPKKGLLARKLRQHRHQQKTLLENILKLLYELGKEDQQFCKGRSLELLIQRRPMCRRTLLQGLRRLQKQGLVQCQAQQWSLTAIGEKKGQEVSTLHELWEFYLAEYLRIKPDHVHEDAESIEHIITPSLALELQRLLQTSKKTIGPSSGNIAPEKNSHAT
ncbi:MAG: metal ABC transporter permease [Bacteroidota bacterium]